MWTYRFGRRTDRTRMQWLQRVQSAEGQVFVHPHSARRRLFIFWARSPLCFFVLSPGSVYHVWSVSRGQLLLSPGSVYHCWGVSWGQLVGVGYVWVTSKRPVPCPAGDLPCPVLSFAAEPRSVVALEARIWDVHRFRSVQSRGRTALASVFFSACWASSLRTVCTAAVHKEACLDSMAVHTYSGIAPHT